MFEEDIEDEYLDDFDCGSTGDGFCLKAGSEECEFGCPYRNELDAIET